MEMERDVLAIIARKAKVDAATLTRATDLSSLDLVSLDMLEIVFDIEERFDISIVYNANEALSPNHKDFKTVADVLDFVASHVRDKATVERKPV